MPTRPSRPCRIGTCPNPATSRGRCVVHTKPDELQRHRFGPAIYNDRRWRGVHGLRAQILREQPLCVLCEAQGRVTLASVADHVIPHRGNAQLAFDRTNVRALCAPCHGRVTAEATLRR